MSEVSAKLSDAAKFHLVGEVEMIKQDDASAIANFHKKGWSIRKLTRECSMSRNTVRKYVRNGGVVEYRQSAPRKGILSGMEEWLKAKFLQHQGNADVIRQELASEKDVKVSLRTVERAVKAYRDELTRKTKATVRFETLPGQQMQIDFGEKLVKIGDEIIKVHFFVAKLSYSRRLYVRAFRHENQQTWLEGAEGAFRYFNGVPDCVVIDNPRALVLNHNKATHEITLNERFKAFASYWGFTPRVCVPGRAQTKGKVENGVGYVKGNCIAGREFESWEGMEAHIARWLVEESDERVLTDPGDTPQSRFENEEQAMLKSVEGRAPFSPTHEMTRKVSKDCFVDVDTNRYSVPWAHIGKEVQVQVTESEVIILLFDGTEIARHALCRGRHQRIEVKEHFKELAYQRDEDRLGSDKSIQDVIPEKEAAQRGELERPLEEYEKAVSAWGWSSTRSIFQDFWNV